MLTTVITIVKETLAAEASCVPPFILVAMAGVVGAGIWGFRLAQRKLAVTGRRLNSGALVAMLILALLTALGIYAAWCYEQRPLGHRCELLGLVGFGLSIFAGCAFIAVPMAYDLLQKEWHK